MDGLNAPGGGSRFVGVDDIRRESVTGTSREKKMALKNRLELQLEEVEGLSLRIDAREEQLKKVPDRSVRGSHSYAHHSKSDNGSSDIKEVTSEPSATSTEVSQVVNAGEAKLARQPSVIVSTGRLPGTPGFAGKEKRTPKANWLYLNPNFVSGKDKMPLPEKLKPMARVGAKRGAPGKAGSARDAKRAKMESARSMQMAEIMKLCGTLLRTLMSRKNAWVFNKPVDAVKLDIPDYHHVIRKPMDLGTIRRKLDGGTYTTPIEFAEDVRLTFLNAMTYNPQGHEVFELADVLRAFFEKRWKYIEEKVDEDGLEVEVEDQALANEGQGQRELSQDVRLHVRSIEDQIHEALPSLVERPTGGRPAAQSKTKPNDVEKRPTAFDEKQKLENASLVSEKSERILQITKKRNLNASHNVNELEIDFDIDSFDKETLWESDRFVTNWAKSGGKVKKKAPPKEPLACAVQDCAQLRPDNGILKSPAKTRKAGKAEEDDVYFDDDVAQPQCQPTVIEKDADSSSGSSSSDSDSGSSSSKSDSSTSSGSDSGSSSSNSDSSSSSGNDSGSDDDEEGEGHGQ